MKQQLFLCRTICWVIDLKYLAFSCFTKWLNLTSKTVFVSPSKTFRKLINDKLKQLFQFRNWNDEIKLNNTINCVNRRKQWIWVSYVFSNPNKTMKFIHFTENTTVKLQRWVVFFGFNFFLFSTKSYITYGTLF